MKNGILIAGVSHTMASNLSAQIWTTTPRFRLRPDGWVDGGTAAARAASPAAALTRRRVRPPAPRRGHRERGAELRRTGEEQGEASGVGPRILDCDRWEWPSGRCRCRRAGTRRNGKGLSLSVARCHSIRIVDLGRQRKCWARSLLGWPATWPSLFRGSTGHLGRLVQSAAAMLLKKNKIGSSK